MLLYILAFESPYRMNLSLQYQHLKYASSSTDLEIGYNILKYIIKDFLYSF